MILSQGPGAQPSEEVLSICCEIMVRIETPFLWDKAVSEHARPRAVAHRWVAVKESGSQIEVRPLHEQAQQWQKAYVLVAGNMGQLRRLLKAEMVCNPAQAVLQNAAIRRCM